MIFLLPKPVKAPASAHGQQRDLPPLITRAIQLWLAQLLSHSLAEYAQKKDPRDRSLQNGLAWSTLQETFGPGTGPGLLHVCLGLYRFARADCPLAPVLFGAGFALYLEQDCFATCNQSGNRLAAPKSDEGGHGGFLGPNIPDLSNQPEQAILLARQTIERWCDWLDASIHLLTHSYWHNSPVSFDPDPEKRDLACLGVVQRFFADQTPLVRALWHHVYSDAVERFKNSPKWLKLGQAMASEQQRPWTYREVDTAIISLWPLLKRHNWTYRDLMNVTRALISRPDAYPCQREQDFTVHCRTVLGLRKTGRGTSSKDGRPPGHQIAREVFTLALTDLPCPRSQL